MGAASQRVEVRLTQLSLAGRVCKTVHTPSDGRARCQAAAATVTAGLWLQEVEGEPTHLQVSLGVRTRAEGLL